MLFLIAIAFLLKRYGTQAVPLPVPATTSFTFDTPIFARDNPSDGCNSRTVLDILWSCLATTFACTWVSVHPNVPWLNEGKWTLLGRRIFLMFFSILAPEFMIVWAFKQWRGAVMIREAVNKASETAFPVTKDSGRNPWTTTHGHLLQMGGFRVSCTPRESNLCYSSFGPRSHRFYRRETSEGTWTTDSFRYDGDSDTIWEGVLTIDALKTLLTENLIALPTITKDEINGKSKCDALSKGFALLQLTWFVVQIITRHAQGLVITELELTTATLAGLNSVMYIFWWSKPRDVRFPVVIRTKAVEKLLAERTEDTTWRFTNQKFDFREHLWTSMTTPIKDVLTSLRKFLVSFPTAVKNMLSDLASAISDLPGHLHSFLSQSYRYFTRAKGAKRGEPDRTSENESSDAPVVVDPEPHGKNESMSRIQKILRELIRCAESVVYCFAILLSLLPYTITFGLILPIAKIISGDGEDGIFLPMVFKPDEQVRVLSMIFYSEDAEVKPLLSTASIAGALFGGVHCLAWHFSFPSHVEQIMWRTASVGIVGACALSFAGTHTLEYLVDFYNGDDDNLCIPFSLFFLLLLSLVLRVLTAVVYIVSRLMLLLIAVTSLRSLPPSAFDTVQWIEFVPHI